jgi:hypothetical protein
MLSRVFGAMGGNTTRAVPPWKRVRDPNAQRDNYELVNGEPRARSSGYGAARSGVVLGGASAR